METTVVVALVGAIGGATGGLLAGVLGAVATLKSKGIDQIVEDRKLWVTAYDTTLLDQRLVEYKKLWKLTEPSSRRYVSKLTEDLAGSLAEQLTNWYYSDGGMIMSEDSRDAFFAARNSLANFTVDSDWSENVIDNFSSLRTALCDDMNARKGPTLKSKKS